MERGSNHSEKEQQCYFLYIKGMTLFGKYVAMLHGSKSVFFCFSPLRLHLFGHGIHLIKYTYTVGYHFAILLRISDAGSISVRERMWGESTAAIQNYSTK